MDEQAGQDVGACYLGIVWHAKRVDVDILLLCGMSLVSSCALVVDAACFGVSHFLAQGYLSVEEFLDILQKSVVLVELPLENLLDSIY